MRIYFDLESSNLLNNSSIDYLQLPYKLKPGYKVHCLVAKDVDTGEIYKYTPDNIDQVVDLFQNATEVIGHNIINFDMRVLQLYFGVDFEIDLEGKQDKVMGRPCEITDTLVISRLLNPDRFGGHSLKEWGKRTGLLKGDYGQQEDAWDTYSEEMLEYCVQDVEVTEATYKLLMKEWGKWDWSDAYKTEKITAYLVGVSEHYGFHFDKNLAESCLAELNTWMDSIEGSVEPQLPLKRMSKTSAKSFIPPKNQIKKDGNLTSHMLKFVMKHDGKISEELGCKFFHYKGRSWQLPMEQEPIEDQEPMRLANQQDMKAWLVSEGWIPTVWADSDLTVDNKKQKLTFDKFKQRVLRYCQETNESPFARFRCDHVKAATVREMYLKMLKHNLERPLKVLTSPKFTVNNDKDICPNLLRLGERVAFVEDVVKWLTYRHRRNAILSPKGTGFLSNLKDDGRIPTPANSCGAATSRFKHSVVCNIPRVTSLYGDKMRALFGVAKGHIQVGYDFSGLEARVEGHYTMQYPGGDEYAVALLAEKPGDIHSVNARKMGVTRDDAKTMKYAISYGAQPAKLSKQMNWTLGHAKEVFNSFWDAAEPLKILKEKVTSYWEKTGNRFIKGVDGRKLYVRSEHSVINLLFQSAGVIAAKKAHILHCTRLQEEGLFFDPFKDSDTKNKAIAMILYHDEAQWSCCRSLVDFYEFDSKQEAEDFRLKGKLLSDVYEEGGKWVRHYSRVGELASMCAGEAAKYYNMRVDLAADYIVGDNWKVCH